MAGAGEKLVFEDVTAYAVAFPLRGRMASAASFNAGLTPRQPPTDTTSHSRFRRCRTACSYGRSFCARDITSKSMCGFLSCHDAQISVVVIGTPPITVQEVNRLQWNLLTGYFLEAVPAHDFSGLDSVRRQSPGFTSAALRSAAARSRFACPRSSGWRRTRIKHLAVDEHVRDLPADLREIRLAVENMGDAGERMKL